MLNQLLHLLTLGRMNLLLQCSLPGNPLCKATGALKKSQMVIFLPGKNILLFHQIQRTNQLHTFKIRAVKLRHHRIHLRSIQHTHQYRFNHIVKMMAQSNFIAAQLPGIGIEIAPAHPRAQITGRTACIHYCLKNIRLKNRNRYSQELCILLNQLTVRRMISRIHHKKLQSELHFSVAKNLLHTLCQKH